jgi:protein-tyrosine phosphatase
MDEILPGLYLGDANDALKAEGMVIICVLEVKPPTEPQGAIFFPFLENGIANMNILRDFASTVDRLLTDGKKVLVHCGGGIERSPLAVAFYISWKRGIPIEEAYQIVEQKHPQTQRRLQWLPH